MRLISFAVISLLTITVSAQPPLSASAANDVPQCDRDVIKQKIQELKASYPAQQEVVLKLETPGKAEREEQEIKSVMKDIEKELKRKNLPEYERPGLEKHYAGSVEDLEKAQAALTAKKQQLDEARNQRYGIWMKINILNENLKREAEQDANNQHRIDASTSSNPHREILQEQIDETCPNAEDLFAADNDIKEGIDKLDDVIKRTQYPKKRLELVRPRNKFVRASDKLFEEFRFAECKCIHVREFQADFGWQLQSSLAYVTRQLLDTAGFFKDPSFDQSRAHGTRYLMLARMDALWTARKAIQIGILVDTHPFSVDHCILCDQQLLSTSIAHLVVECEQVTGHRIQSGLVPAIQKSRLRLLGRALDPGVENVYTWLRGGVLNGEADLDQQWLDGTVEHESMGTRHDNRALAARLADFLQVAYRQYQSTLWKTPPGSPCGSCAKLTSSTHQPMPEWGMACLCFMDLI
ncbi:hypothetical protein BASA50_010333 [Batrachochytrium salamandrivorans]|uniref:Uncharacterized protein n=1 Tax=Batrachochytrium salamandrivorans TaxID=1357716 RepID=A0ABQ8EYT6_9FUNG|nr:hypothetical protein BASA50_010333 [Batrachochytrium salamandrivorans]